jgi:hypothetical protein
MRTLTIASIVLILSFGACKPSQKQPESPVQSGTRASIPEIEKDIRTHIEQVTKINQGYFPVSDRGQNFKMKLVRVHTEYLSSLGPGKSFACVDLVDISGDVYDVDFFLDGEPGAMTVTETSVHKLNGKPFYAWKQKADKSWYRLPMEQADRGLLGVIEGEDNFEFIYAFSIPELKQNARLWIPIANSDTHQTIHKRSIKFPGNYRLIEDSLYQNTFLFAEVEPNQSSQAIEIRYQVTRKERGPETFLNEQVSNYLKPNQTIPVGGRFASIARQALHGRSGSDLMNARALYDHVISQMRYMKYGNFGGGDANYACDSKTGNCSEFHSYFISLARSIGIPARFSIGASIPSDRNEGGIDGYHCWAEFYADGKWWPVDISEANKYSALATYYFGHHPANRIQLSNGRDIVVTPGPAAGPINFIAYPLIEINKQTSNVRTTFSFVRSGKQTS